MSISSFIMFFVVCAAVQSRAVLFVLTLCLCSCQCHHSDFQFTSCSNLAILNQCAAIANIIHLVLSCSADNSGRSQNKTSRRPQYN